MALWVCALVERASSSPGKSRPERPDHSSSPPPSADSLPLGGGRRPGALSRIGFCTYRETKGVSPLELAKEDQSPSPVPACTPRSGNWPECFRGLDGCLILRGSGPSWGRQRITLGPGKSQAAPYKNVLASSKFVLLSPQRVEGLRREARYNAVTKSLFLPAASTMKAFYYFWSAYCMQGSGFV